MAIVNLMHDIVTMGPPINDKFVRENDWVSGPKTEAFATCMHVNTS